MSLTIATSRCWNFRFPVRLTSWWRTNDQRTVNESIWFRHPIRHYLAESGHGVLYYGFYFKTTLDDSEQLEHILSSFIATVTWTPEEHHDPLLAAIKGARRSFGEHIPGKYMHSHWIQLPGFPYMWGKAISQNDMKTEPLTKFVAATEFLVFHLMWRHMILKKCTYWYQSQPGQCCRHMPFVIGWILTLSFLEFQVILFLCRGRRLYSINLSKFCHLVTYPRADVIWALLPLHA